MLRLELTADSVRFVKQVSTGALTEVNMTDQGSQTTLTVGALNTGKLTARYTLQVE